MPDKFKDTINLPIAIPAWGLLTALGTIAVGGAYYGGGMVTKLDQLIEITRETKMAQASQQQQIDRINERQINGLAKIDSNTQRIVNLENRLERGIK